MVEKQKVVRAFALRAKISGEPTVIASHALNQFTLCVQVLEKLPIYQDITVLIAVVMCLQVLLPFTKFHCFPTELWSHTSAAKPKPPHFILLVR